MHVGINSPRNGTRHAKTIRKVCVTPNLTMRAGLLQVIGDVRTVVVIVGAPQCRHVRLLLLS